MATLAEKKEYPDGSLAEYRDTGACCQFCGHLDVLREFKEYPDGTLIYVRDTEICCGCLNSGFDTLREYKEYQDGTLVFSRDTGACCGCRDDKPGDPCDCACCVSPCIPNTACLEFFFAIIHPDNSFGVEGVATIAGMKLALTYLNNCTYAFDQTVNGFHFKGIVSASLGYSGPPPSNCNPNGWRIYPDVDSDTSMFDDLFLTTGCNPFQLKQFGDYTGRVFFGTSDVFFGAMVTSGGACVSACPHPATCMKVHLSTALGANVPGCPTGFFEIDGTGSLTWDAVACKYTGTIDFGVTWGSGSVVADSAGFTWTGGCVIDLPCYYFGDALAPDGSGNGFNGATYLVIDPGGIGGTHISVSLKPC